jgi:hypothetical protein
MKKYISVFLIVLVVVVVGQEVYKQLNKKTPKASRIACQKRTTSFERGYDKKEIKLAKQKLATGNFVVDSYVEKPVYTKSTLFDFISLKQTDKTTQEALSKYINQAKESSDKLKISYYIYENDVNDPGKKTKKSKLYVGYVVYRFYGSNNRVIYQSQIDFMDKKGADINKSIACAIKSFATYPTK